MGQFCASIRSPVTDSKGHLLNEANLASSTTSSEKLAQNGLATRGCCGRVSEMFGAAIGGLCAFVCVGGLWPNRVGHSHGNDHGPDGSRIGKCPRLGQKRGNRASLHRRQFGYRQLHRGAITDRRL